MSLPSIERWIQVRRPCSRDSRVLVHHGAVLIERFAADYDVGESHVVTVDAGVEHSYRAVLDVDLFRSRIIRTLYLVRGLSARGPLTLRDMTRMGFVVLDEDPGTEIVLGLVRRFWLAQGGVRRVEAADFGEFSEPGYVRVLRLLDAHPSGAPIEWVTASAAQPIGDLLVI